MSKGKGKGQSTPADEGGIKIICENRNARHNYFIEEKYEAGLVLKGTEVKALRDAKANLRDAYAVFKGSELFLVNAHISPYSQGNLNNHDPLRSRKLLLHRDQLKKLWSRVEIRGYALVPLKLYFKKGKVKVEVAIGKGKDLHDKRDTDRDRDAKREMDRAMKGQKR